MLFILKEYLCLRFMNGASYFSTQYESVVSLALHEDIKESWSFRLKETQSAYK